MGNSPGVLVAVHIAKLYGLQATIGPRITCEVQAESKLMKLAF